LIISSAIIYVLAPKLLEPVDSDLLKSLTRLEDLEVTVLDFVTIFFLENLSFVVLFMHKFLIYTKKR
jgi:hypothetical protein